uniref:Uncharacterized protein n=1 Tax=Anguilla anguilla TaxID=7936 RepID=A0A0E9SBN6_ANGAN
MWSGKFRSHWTPSPLALRPHPGPLRFSARLL